MLAILVAATLPLGPVARGVIVLMAVSPGAPMLMNKSQASGNVALAAALAVGLTVAAVVFLPVELFVLNRLFPWRLHASTPALLENVVPKLILPLVVGALLHRVWPKAADKLAPVVRTLFHAALLVAVVGALAVSWREILHMGPWAWLAMLIVTLGAVLMGDAFGGRDPRDRATAAYAVVLGNPAVAMSRGRRELPVAAPGADHPRVRGPARGLRPPVCGPGAPATREQPKLRKADPLRYRPAGSRRRPLTRVGGHRGNHRSAACPTTRLRK